MVSIYRSPSRNRLETDEEMGLKSRLIAECHSRLEKRRLEITAEQDDIARAIASETKSSAGDKHETARALMQNQREQIGQRLKETETMIGALQQVDLQNVHSIVRSGSLVTTNKGTFLICVAFGRFETDNTVYFLISPQSPLAALMTGKKEGDQFSFNNQEYRIVEVE